MSFITLRVNRKLKSKRRDKLGWPTLRAIPHQDFTVRFWIFKSRTNSAVEITRENLGENFPYFRVCSFFFFRETNMLIISRQEYEKQRNKQGGAVKHERKWRWWRNSSSASTPRRHQNKFDSSGVFKSEIFRNIFHSSLKWFRKKEMPIRKKKSDLAPDANVNIAGGTPSCTTAIHTHMRALRAVSH